MVRPFFHASERYWHGCPRVWPRVRFHKEVVRSFLFTPAVRLCVKLFLPGVLATETQPHLLRKGSLNISQACDIFRR